MLWEVLGSTLLGLATALAARKWLPGQFPTRLLPLTLATGAVSGLLGGLIARAVLGPGHLAATLLIAVGVSTALLSLLIRPKDNGRSRDGMDPAGPRVGTGTV